MSVSVRLHCGTALPAEEQTIGPVVLWLKARSTVSRWLACRHRPLPLTEGRFICPDCHHGVVVRWVMLRCLGCHRRRIPQAHFSIPKPMDPNCPHCGETDIRLEVIKTPAYYQLPYVTFWVQNESTVEQAPQSFQEITYLWPRRVQRSWQSAKAWLEPATSAQQTSAKPA